MLPKDMTMAQAAAGFKNQGQFIAALHASQNLGVPFSRVKTEMVENNRSLGQTIKTVKSSADSDAETTRAQTQTTKDLINTDPTIPHEEEDPWPKAKASTRSTPTTTNKSGRK